MRGALFACTMAFAIAAQASGIFYPVKFNNEHLANRSDVRELLKELHVVYPEHQEDVQFVTTEVRDVQLTFFKEILELLNRLKHLDSLPEHSRNPKIAQYCPQHLRNNEGLPPVVGTEPVCERIRSDLQSAFDSSELGCQSIYEPEKILLNHKPGQVSFQYARDLKSILKMAGHALFQMPELAKVLTQEHVDVLRSALQKIYFEEFQSQLNQRQSVYGKLLKDVDQTTCFARAAEDVRAYKDRISSLIAESRDAQSDLNEIVRRGRTIANEERAAAKARGRKRNDLPFNSLVDREREIVSMYLGSVLWRIRGGGLTSKPNGTQKRRFLAVHLPFNEIGTLLASRDGDAQGTELFWRLLKGWGEYFDMGHDPTRNDYVYDLVHMTDRGAYQVKFSVDDLDLMNYDSYIMKAAGLQMGPCYFYGWEEMINVRVGENLRAPFLPFLEGPTAIGEVCMGATLGLALSRSYLKGFTH